MKVIEAKQLEGHGTCDSRVGMLQILEVESHLAETLQVSASLKIDFSTVGGLAPDGVWDTTTWTIID